MSRRLEVGVVLGTIVLIAATLISQVSFGRLNARVEKALPQEFSTEFSDHKITATIPGGWSQELILGSSRTDILLGSWTGSFLGDQGSIQIRGLSEVKSFDAYIAGLSNANEHFTADRVLERVWAVAEGNQAHHQLYRLKANGTNREAYFFRTVRMLRTGEGKACVMVMFIRLEANPGSHSTYMNSRRLKGHLTIMESFKAEPK
jgi:hypothetical protein